MRNDWKFPNDPKSIRIAAAVAAYLIGFMLAAWTYGTFAGGESAFAARSDDVTFVRETPFDGAKFLGKPVRIESASIVTLTTPSGYGYAPAVELRLDLGELTDAEKYWFFKEGSFVGRCYLSDEANGFRSSELTARSVRAEGDVAVVTWVQEDPVEWMRPFDGAEAAIVATFLERSEWDDDAEGEGIGSYVTERRRFLIEIDGDGAMEAAAAANDADETEAPGGTERRNGTDGSDVPEEDDAAEGSNEVVDSTGVAAELESDAALVEESLLEKVDAAADAAKAFEQARAEGAFAGKERS